MGSVIVSPEAEADLLDIWDYIANDGVAAADRILDAIKSASVMLSDAPHVGRSREELLRGLRSLAVGNYIIFYRPERDGISVVRVLHGARDIPELF